MLTYDPRKLHCAMVHFPSFPKLCVCVECCARAADGVTDRLGHVPFMAWLHEAVQQSENSVECDARAFRRAEVFKAKRGHSVVLQVTQDINCIPDEVRNEQAQATG